MINKIITISAYLMFHSFCHACTPLAYKVHAYKSAPVCSYACLMAYNNMAER